jgi:DNA-binding response OmpR family regulator
VTSAHIVVVDDEPDLRDMVREYLLKQGYAVSEAESGDALWTLLAERPVDLAILDINMPGEDGLSIARQLRKRGPVGIIMLTANSDTSTACGAGGRGGRLRHQALRSSRASARVRSVLRRASRPEAPPATMGP